MFAYLLLSPRFDERVAENHNKIGKHDMETLHSQMVTRPKEKGETLHKRAEKRGSSPEEFRANCREKQPD